MLVRRYAPNGQAFLAVPVPTLAGVRQPHLGDIWGSLVNGVARLFGAKSHASETKAILGAQRDIVTAELAAQSSLAQMQTDLGRSQIDAAVRVAQSQAQAQLAAIDASYSAALASQRAQKQIANETLASQLAADSQSGIYSLAQSSLAESSATARAFPRASGWTITALVIGTALAVAAMKTKPKFGRRQGGGPRNAAPAFAGSSA